MLTKAVSTRCNSPLFCFCFPWCFHGRLFLSFISRLKYNVHGLLALNCYRLNIISCSSLSLSLRHIWRWDSFWLVDWSTDWLKSIYLCSDINSMRTMTMSMAEIHMSTYVSVWHIERTYFSPPPSTSIIFHQLCLLELSGLLIKFFWTDFPDLLLCVLCYFPPGTKICLDHYKRTEFFWGISENHLSTAHPPGYELYLPLSTAFCKEAEKC